MKKATKKKHGVHSPHILITGAGKGIGRAIVEEFCVLGKDNPHHIHPRLFITSRTASDLKKLQKLAHDSGVECEFLPGDLSSLSFLKKLLAKAKSQFGSIDCLVNNAGVGKFCDYKDITEKDFDHVMDTNLKGTFFLTQNIFSEMSKKKSGHIFFVTSVAAIKPFEMSSVYCMSKFGQRGLIEVLRLLAYKNNVKITDVLPGAVETPMWGKVSKKMHDLMMQPEDIAKAVVDTYLLPERTNIEEIIIRPVGGDIQ